MADTCSMRCPFPPCINLLTRPISALGAINQFESAASSVYHGATLSVRRRMTNGFLLPARLYVCTCIGRRTGRTRGRPRMMDSQAQERPSAGWQDYWNQSLSCVLSEACQSFGSNSRVCATADSVGIALDLLSEPL